jgi:hypothetical protein
MPADIEPPSDDAEFISEPIEPEAGSFSTAMMTTGLASPPRAFRWRDRRYEIVEQIHHEKLSSREGHTAAGDLYLRRQQFVVRLDTGQIATIYFERQARPGVRGRSAKKRWFLYTITSSEATEGGETG